MTRQKNKILMFLFAWIPGAGQMYMGFMKQGLSLMTMFAALCAVGVWLELKPLLFFAPIILLYSFFDATNKNAMDAEAFKRLEDHYLWGDDWMDFSEGLRENISRRDGKKAMGIIMYVIAACMIWSAVKYFADILYGPSSLPGAVIGKIPVIAAALFVFWMGHKLTRSASDDEKRFFRGMPYPYLHDPALRMNGERVPNPWERVWREPEGRMAPEHGDHMPPAADAMTEKPLEIKEEKEEAEVRAEAETTTETKVEITTEAKAETTTETKAEENNDPTKEA